MKFLYAANYREALLRALDETEAAYGALQLAQQQQAALEAQLSLATQRSAATRRQLDAGRAARGAVIEAELQALEVAQQLQEAALQSRRALAQLHFVLGRRPRNSG